MLEFTLHKEMKFVFKYFFSKCDQILSFLLSKLSKIFLMKNFIFRAVLATFRPFGWGLDCGFADLHMAKMKL